MAPDALGPALLAVSVYVTFEPPATGFGAPVLVSARLAPVLTVVTSDCVLLDGLTSLSAVSVAVAPIVVGPGPSARQRIVMSLGPVPLPAIDPSSQTTRVGVCSAQLADAGDADTNVAPAGTSSVSRVLVAASGALLSTRT